jgi:hypothetical protein
MSSTTKYEEVRLVHAMSCFADLTVKRRRDEYVGPVLSWRRWYDRNHLACRKTWRCRIYVLFVLLCTTSTQ